MYASIREIVESDLPLLRQWKNEHKDAFFHKEDITEERQREWYREIEGRDNDFMFMVVTGEIPVGCIGVRLIDEKWDIYNVIMGDPRYRNKGLMRKALDEVIKFAVTRRNVPVRCKVIEGNPAVGWYSRNGFKIVWVNPDHIIMEYK